MSNDGIGGGQSHRTAQDTLRVGYSNCREVNSQCGRMLRHEEAQIYSVRSITWSYPRKSICSSVVMRFGLWCYLGVLKFVTSPAHQQLAVRHQSY